MLSEPKIIQQGQNYHVQYGDDSGLYVEFSMEPIQNDQRSEEEGRPIFEDKEYITIRIIGDTKTVRKRPVQLNWVGNTPPDHERWPRQYQAFKSQQSQILDGTPIIEWASITKSDAASMKAMNIHTVEMLASLGENNLNWLGARQMRDKAKAWLEQAKDGSGLTRLIAENETLKNDIQALKNQIAALSISGDKEDLEVKKRGRPRKEG